ncbi:MAG: NUDIX domain-containing protein [Thermomicrobiales bacterium]
MTDTTTTQPQPAIFVIVNVEVAILRDGRYLVTERGRGESFGAGWLGFPGGKLEWHDGEQDAIEATARREAEEETGVTLAPEIAYVESHTFGTDAPCLDIVVLACLAEDSPEATIRDPEEVAALAWMTIAEIAADPRTQPWTLASLRLAEQVRERLGW